MAQITSNKFIRGLSLNANPYVGTPGADPYGASSNATTIADNLVLTRQRMVGNRRGFSYFTQPTSANIDAMLEYQSFMIEHQSDDTLWWSDPTTGVQTQYSGSYTPPAGYRMDGAVGRGSLFFTSTGGPMKLDAYTNTPQRSGITKGLDTRGSPTGTGNGFMSGISKVGYHVTWVRTDANNQQVRGDVSTRLLVTNDNQQVPSTITSTGGTATVTTPLAHGFTSGDHILVQGATLSNYNGSFVIAVTSGTIFTYTVTGSPASPAVGNPTLTVEKQLNTTITFTTPWDVLTNDSFEVWRTVTVEAIGGDDPGDNCFLVQSVVNTNAAGTTISYTDTVPDTILQTNTPLYTNATESGALAGNARPPLCTAICTYKDYTIYANSTIDQTLTLNLLAITSLSAGSSAITLMRSSGGSRTYTCNTSEVVSTQTFQLFTGGISNALDIQETVQSLCHVINGDSGGYWYAEYTAGPNDDPGIFRIWARSPISGTFVVTSSDSTTSVQFLPVIPTTGTSLISSGDPRPNRLFVSAFQQPDAVPLLNNIDVGNLDEPILRVIPVRDACYVIKTDGVYYLSGLVYPFSLTELDSTCECVAASTAVALNNMIFMLSNQGVVTLSLSGVTVISFDIEDPIMTDAIPLSNISTVAFGIAHEADRAYYLWVPTLTGDTVATQCWVYHTFVTEWTRWTKPAVSGIVLKSNYALYIASGLEPAVLKQRRNGNNTDYADEEIAVTVVSQTGTALAVTWTSTVFVPTAGIVIQQSANTAKVVSLVNTSGSAWTFTLDWAVTFTAGAASAYIPIYSHARLSPNVLGEIGLLKSIYAVSYVLQTESVSQVTLEVATNEAPNMLTFPIVRITGGGWGTNAWGVPGWGDVVSPVRSVPWQIDLPIPDNTGESISSGWIHGVAQEQFIIAQVSVTWDQDADYEVTA